MPYNQIKKEEEFYKLLTIDNYEELIEFTKNNKLLERYVNDLIMFSKEEGLIVIWIWELNYTLEMKQYLIWEKPMA